MALAGTRSDEGRKQQIRESLQAINGIDHVEELPLARAGDTGACLLVYLLKPDGIQQVGPELVSVRSGSRIASLPVAWTAVATKLLPDDTNLQEFLRARDQLEPVATDRILVVRIALRGDQSSYRLSIASPPGMQFDPKLGTADFSFRAGLEGELDFAATGAAAATAPQEPEIDYLARDFGSFRRLMLDRLSSLMPDWKERNPADLGVTLVEALASAGDYLSYYQDAVATEAYLGTARKRISVRRHARLLDMLMHEGCNARTFVALEVGSGPPFSLLPGPGVQVQFLTAVDGLPVATDASGLGGGTAALAGAEVFEPLHDLVLRQEHNEIPLYEWGGSGGRLLRGATSATLRDQGGGLRLVAGDLLLLEEMHASSSRSGGAPRRQVVRLTSAIPGADPLYDEKTEAPQTGSDVNPDPLRLLEVHWSDADALSFDLPLAGGVARGNVVLVDHGRRVFPDEEVVVSEDPALDPPRLKQVQITHQGMVRDARGALVLVDPAAPASHALRWEVRDAQPAVSLREVRTGSAQPGPAWSPRKDLLACDRWAPEFVLEVDDQQRACLRFGDGLRGRRPPRGARFTARYRVGNGSRGNLGAEALRHVIFTRHPGVGEPGRGADRIRRVRNPVPATGGLEPQSVDEVRLLAPTSFREQERAVTEEDYASIAERHPDVRKAAAAFRWTGSWHTVFLYVDREEGAPVDDSFRARVEAFMDRFRMARHDLRVEGPRYVSLDIALTVHVQPLHLQSAVRRALLDALGAGLMSDGTPGFFHRSRWTFGQPVLLSRLVTAAMAVPGVRWVDYTKPDLHRFQRWGVPAAGELALGTIAMGPLEIARLDTDAGLPELGRLSLDLQGGL